MPGQKIAETDRRKIDAKFLCVVCGLLLVAPMQTGCGHLLCLVCLQSLLSSKKAVCPVDGTMLIQREIFLDAFTKRALMGVRLHCPNESCEWFGTNKELQKHVADECLVAPLTCEYCKKTNIRREEMETHKTQDCQYIPMDLGFKPVGCEPTKVKLLSEKFTSLLKKFTGLEKKVESLESRGTNYEKVIGGNIKIIDGLRTKVEQLDEALALSTVKLADLECKESIATPTYNGSLLWKIDAFTRKRQDAVKGVQTAMYSPPFYSGQNGYKMCAKIYLNGDRSGKDTHISLFFVVMKGEYDALLPWPFQKKITMMLMDQNNGNHMIDAFRSDPQSSSFQRPKSNVNIASGSPLFMPVDGLTSGAYVKDDTVFVKIIVD